MLKENISSMKKSLKQTKVKKVIDKDKMAINKGHKTYPEVLTFLKLEEELTSELSLINSDIEMLRSTSSEDDLCEQGYEFLNEIIQLYNEYMGEYEIEIELLELGHLFDESLNILKGLLVENDCDIDPSDFQL